MILTENFLYAPGFLEMFLANIGLIFVLWFFAVRFRSVGFSVSSIVFLLSLIAVNIYRFVVEEREKTHLLVSIEKYFAPPLLKEILKAPKTLTAPQKKELTILFSDIKNFTRWCEKQIPEAIHETLNEFFDEMTNIIFKYKGILDKFIGDGLIAFFGHLIPEENHALLALNAAIEMQQKVQELRKKWETSKKLPLQIRIGVNSGVVSVGNMGSNEIMDYTIIGSEVNLAQRLETNSPPGGILISENVYTKIEKAFKKNIFSYTHQDKGKRYFQKNNRI
jgi:adenylate cyclase